MQILTKNIEFDFRRRCYLHLSMDIKETVEVATTSGTKLPNIALGRMMTQNRKDSRSYDKTDIDRFIEIIATEVYDLIDQDFYIVPKSGQIKHLTAPDQVELSFEVAPEQTHGNIVNPIEDNLIPVGEEIYIHDTYDFIEAMRTQSEHNVVSVEYGGDYYHVYAGNMCLKYHNKVYLLNGQKAK